MCSVFVNSVVHPPASKASWEVENLTERKNLHTLINNVKEFFHMLQTMNPIISGLAEQNGQNKFKTSMAKSHVSKTNLSEKWPVGLGLRAKTAKYNTSELNQCITLSVNKRKHTNNFKQLIIY